MKYDRITKDSDIDLPGVEVEVDRIDNGIRAVTLRAGDKLVRFVEKSSYETLEVLVPARPKLKDAYLLTGTILGIPVSEAYEYDFEANSRKNKLEYADSNAKLEVVKFQIPEDQSFHEES